MRGEVNPRQRGSATSLLSCPIRGIMAIMLQQGVPEALLKGLSGMVRAVFELNLTVFCVGLQKRGDLSQKA